MSRILSDWIDSFLDYTNSTEPAEMYRMWVAVSTIAAVLKRKCTLNWGTVKVFPNMYIVLVGPPAARKGTAMGFGIDFLFRAEIALSADSITKEALILSIKENYENSIDLNSNMCHHCSFTICSPEFSVLIGHNDPQMLRYLTDWFDCGKGPEGIWTHRTKTQGVDKISGIWVNLIGATTPEQIGMCPDMVGVGLASRIIFVFEEKKSKIQPYPFLSEYQEDLREKLYKDLEQILLLQGEFKPTTEWIDAWGPWYISANTDPPFKDRRLSKYCERRPLHILKLCMILSASRSDDMIITLNDLNRAVDILERTEIKMPQAFGSMGDDPDAKLLNNIMRDIIIEGEIDRQELLTRHYFDATNPRKFEAIITTLQSMGFLTVKRSVGEGGSVVEKIIHVKKKEDC